MASWSRALCITQEVGLGGLEGKANREIRGRSTDTHRGETCNLVPQPLCLDVSNIFTDALVGVKVESELLVVLLHQHTGCPLDGLGPDASLQHKQYVYNGSGSSLASF
jgi:hypothetical protein